jgi:hypothetical protein
MSACKTKSFTVLGADGNHITASETDERKEIMVAIQQNDEHGRIATIRLNQEQFKALCDVKYDLEVNADVPVPAEVLA